jgi:hypothetical protein
MTVTGSCLCSAVTFECEEVGPAGFCHCEDCRRCTGSAFSISVPCALSGFRKLTGHLGSFTKTGATGSEISRHFCVSCGSPIFTSSPRHPEVIYIKAGVLDDPNAVKPDRQAWTGSKVSWAEISTDIASFQKGKGEVP